MEAYARQQRILRGSQFSHFAALRPERERETHIRPLVPSRLNPNPNPASTPTPSQDPGAKSRVPSIATTGTVESFERARGGRKAGASRGSAESRESGKSAESKTGSGSKESRSSGSGSTQVEELIGEIDAMLDVQAEARAFSVRRMQRGGEEGRNPAKCTYTGKYTPGEHSAYARAAAWVQSLPHSFAPESPPAVHDSKGDGNGCEHRARVDSVYTLVDHASATQCVKIDAAVADDTEAKFRAWVDSRSHVNANANARGQHNVDVGKPIRRRPAPVLVLSQEQEPEAAERPSSRGTMFVDVDDTGHMKVSYRVRNRKPVGEGEAIPISPYRYRFGLDGAPASPVPGTPSTPSRALADAAAQRPVSNNRRPGLNVDDFSTVDVFAMRRELGLARQTIEAQEGADPKEKKSRRKGMVKYLRKVLHKLKGEMESFGVAQEGGRVKEHREHRQREQSGREHHRSQDSGPGASTGPEREHRPRHHRRDGASRGGSKHRRRQGSAEQLRRSHSRTDTQGTEHGPAKQMRFVKSTRGEEVWIRSQRGSGGLPVR